MDDMGLPKQVMEDMRQYHACRNAFLDMNIIQFHRYNYYIYKEIRRTIFEFEFILRKYTDMKMSPLRRLNLAFGDGFTNIRGMRWFDNAWLLDEPCSRERFNESVLNTLMHLHPEDRVHILECIQTVNMSAVDDYAFENYIDDFWYDYRQAYDDITGECH